MAQPPNGERPPLPTPPLCVIPAATLGCQAVTNVNGEPCVMIQMTNAVFHVNFPMDLDQAAKHIEDMQRAILDARNVVLPPGRIQRL